MTELLLANKAEVNVRDSERQTPLHKAALYSRKVVAELLLAHMARGISGSSILNYSGRW
jgi:ankyrin repeat protein